MDRVFGIDLGTTHSLIGYWGDGAPRLIPDTGGDPLLPSVVAFPPGTDSVVGEAARDYLWRDPARAIADVKRRMGIDQRPVLEVDGTAYSATRVSARILEELKLRAEASLGEEVRRAVITVPAYFNERQRHATRTAGQLAGLDVLRLLNEPTAAALAYRLDRHGTGIIAVYDLGGGTFDVSILRLQQGVFEVMATTGNTFLGGRDFDERLATFFLQHVPEGLRFDPRMRALARHSAEVAKHALSQTLETTVRLDVGDGSLDIDLSRAKLEELGADLVLATLHQCQRALEDAHLEARDLDAILLVGGATRMPLIRNRVAELFGQEPLTDIDPDRAVALGAATQAGVLSGQHENHLLLDVVPLSLGIETIGGVMERLVERNSLLPALSRREFTTFADEQTAIEIHVLQGERELAQDNLSLARFKLGGIEPRPAGTARVQVQFLVDANGLLHVSASDLASGVERSIDVNAVRDLDDTSVDRILDDAFCHAAEDAERRALADARSEARRLLQMLRQSIASDVSAADELATIETAMAALESGLSSSSSQSIRQLTEALLDAVTPVAQRRMDTTIRRALTGKSIDSVL